MSRAHRARIAERVFPIDPRVRRRLVWYAQRFGERMSTSSTESYPPLLSLAVHEFRTPASVVGGYLRMLQRDGDGLSDRHRKMIDEAEKSCARLVGLIAELSDIGKIDSGLLTLNRERLDVFSLVSEV